jgi:thiol-disulfide isomerase/thioredoxin
MAESVFQESSAAEQQHLPPERKRAAVWPWALLLLGLAVVLVVRAFSPAADEPRGERHPAVGTPVTEFSLLPLTGDAAEVTPGSLDGKVTLVNFWGPWCPACVVEFPHLVEIEEHFRGDERFQFISISTNQNPFDERGLAENTAEFLKRHKADFPTYRDPKAGTTQALEAAFQLEGWGYPVTLLIGPDRRLLAFWTGYGPGDEKEVERAVEAALRALKRG